MPFRSILLVFITDLSQQQALKKKCCPKFAFPFFVKTTERVFEFFAATEEEREMWMAGFDYCIKSTRVVQKIIEQNEKKLKEKIAHGTKKLNLTRCSSVGENPSQNKTNHTKVMSFSTPYKEGTDLFKSSGQIRKENLAKSALKSSKLDLSITKSPYRDFS